MSPPGYRTPLTLACAPSTPRAGSTYLVPCSPFAVSPALGFSRHGSPPRACSSEQLRGDAGPAIGAPLKCLISRSPPPLASGGTALMGFRALQHRTARRIRFPRGFHTPAPSALEVSHPLDGLHPSGPRDDPSTATALVGFSLQGLPSPGQRYPSRGLASPVVLPPAHKGPTVATSEVDSWPEKGPGPSTSADATAQTLPSWDFAPPGLSPPSPSNRLPGPSPSCLSGRKCSLRFHFRARLQGIVNDESGLSLSRLPALLGFRTSRNRACR